MDQNEFEKLKNEKVLPNEELLGSILLKQKIDLGREHGLTVKTKDEMKCETHPGAKFVQEETNGWARYAFYHCEECKKEQRNVYSFNITSYYFCPHCGFVKGVAKRKDYCSDRESWESLGGRQGNHYFCYICDVQVGYEYFRIS